MADAFISANAICVTLPVAKIYLGTRQEDYAVFCKGFSMKVRNEKELIHSFENGYEAAIYSDGSIALIDPQCDTGKFFASFEQFSAYYLARFW